MTLERILMAIGALACCFVLVAALLPVDEEGEDRSLPALGADLSQTTVSGISSGAYMAGQFQIAHADIVTGAAIIAGGPYGCAESAFAGIVPGPGTVFLNASRAVNGCMLNTLSMWGVPNPSKLAKRAIRLSEAGDIGSLEDIRRDRVYLFSGSRDTVVVPAIVEAAVEFYRQLGMPAGSVVHINDIAAGHAFVTMDKGGACDRSASPYIVDCDHDQAGNLLRHLYGGLAPRGSGARGSFITFDQRDYNKDLRDHGMSVTAAAYVPSECRKAGSNCRIHVAFHGCEQNRAEIGDKFIKDTGFAPWAETNRLIVLFPQAGQSTLNPKGCWDWWGYTGRDYLTRKGPQIIAVRRMLDRLAQQPATN